MDNLITISDFKNPYLVFAVAGEVSETYLNELIAKYQKEILRKILGVVTYNDMETNITDNIWDRFINGYTYTVDSVEYQYKGIKEVLTNFIFYYWSYNVVNNLVPFGSIAINYEENDKTIDVNKMVHAWNDAINLIDNNILYDATVYHYLENFAPDTWIFNVYDKQNILGI